MDDIALQVIQEKFSGMKTSEVVAVLNLISNKDGRILSLKTLNAKLTEKPAKGKVVQQQFLVIKVVSEAFTLL